MSRVFLLLRGLGLLGFQGRNAWRSPPAVSAKPNVLVIVCDDLATATPGAATAKKNFTITAPTQTSGETSLPTTATGR